MQILREAQVQHGWLPRAMLADLADGLGPTLAHVEGAVRRDEALEPPWAWRRRFRHRHERRCRTSTLCTPGPPDWASAGRSGSAHALQTNRWRLLSSFGQYCSTTTHGRPTA
ncbi:hypothetical protein ACFQVB_40855 [Paraburkholderia humisilvae]|uniref:hypothetical protein n=1 Tax=Paraburkholderia humisilvae TaxID=627669 RepID=UPI00361D20A0